MAQAQEEFALEIRTPARELLEWQVSEVVLPAIDGEVGVLAHHEDFIGEMGTGTLKVVRDGNDYWLMVSSGVFEVRNGKLSVLAEIAESDKEIDAELAGSSLRALEAQENLDVVAKRQMDRAKARLEVYRRTHLVN